MPGLRRRQGLDSSYLSLADVGEATAFIPTFLMAEPLAQTLAVIGCAVGPNLKVAKDGNLFQISLFCFLIILFRFLRMCCYPKTIFPRY